MCAGDWSAKRNRRVSWLRIYVNKEACNVCRSMSWVSRVVCVHEFGLSAKNEMYVRATQNTHDLLSELEGNLLGWVEGDQFLLLAVGLAAVGS